MTNAVAAREQLASLLKTLTSELGDAATLTVTHDGGWELKPKKPGASHVSVDADEDLLEVTIGFGTAGRIELNYGWDPEPEDALRRTEVVVRGVIAGGLRERWKANQRRDRLRGSRWKLRLPDGENLRGGDDFPFRLPWQATDEQHYAAWTQ